MLVSYNRKKETKCKSELEITERKVNLNQDLYRYGGSAIPRHANPWQLAPGKASAAHSPVQLFNNQLIQSQLIELQILIQVLYP